ncbi:HAMP domain-containing sensor histidine kinase [Bacillus sp. SM2101]|uniref:sensor histidine kinase n=1 Tax=Bacillus sp. SM2101 TaxID=2805366 RepID=UPI001BDF3CC0|nr:HAMP domain-containing sensor histidine kinase [Bacillus sp. SM2101]
MKKNFYKTIGWSLLVSIILIAVTSTLENAHRFIGNQDYFQTDEFQSEYHNYIRELSSIVLNNPDKEQLKETVSVSQQEIDQYRFYYGDLTSQIQNIQGQYQSRILEAEASGNTSVKDALTKERDAKIADVQKNFEDDEYVEKKIKAVINTNIDSYIAELNAKKQDFVSDFTYFSYELKNIETGETFSSGDVSEKAAFTMEFSKKNGYLKASQYLDSASYYIGGEYNEETGIDVNNKITTLLKASPSTFEGKITIPVANMNQVERAQYFIYQKNLSLIMLAIAVVALLIILLIFKFRKSWYVDSSVRRQYENWPLDIRLVLILINGWIVMIFTFMLKQDYYSLFSYYNYQSVEGLLFNHFIHLFAIWFGIYQVVWTYDELKQGLGFIETLKNGIVVKNIKLVRDAFLKTAIGKQMLAILIVIFFWGIGTAIAFANSYDDGLIMFYLICVFFIGIPSILFLMKRIRYLNRVFRATEQMASGTLLEPVPEKGKSVIAKHAKHLNKLRAGIKTSLTEQAKSERLKTELITNVSHDLRTPLTSIITYTDLLKNQQLTEEERNEYVNILERKSNRLKILIEDLFEVSKMASGNLELHKQQVDLTQLIHQVLGEHQEDIEKSGLDFRITIPDTSVMSYVDGQRWWRVLDNLIVNALKYSLTGTRVYVSLKHENNQAEFVVKNITKYELGENINELLERFKRADTSRATEGSGLGLAIAQSIVDLHGGTLQIDLDGDLFKVIVKIPTS